MKRKIIKLGKAGNMGNKIIQHMYCMNLSERVENSFLCGYNIKEMNMFGEDCPLEGRTLHVTGGHRHSLDQMAYYLNEGIYDSIYFEGFVQRLEYFSNRKKFLKIFPIMNGFHSDFVSDRYIILNVRGREILGNLHPDYSPAPIDFLVKAVEASKREPIIMGQMGNDFYSDAIKENFPGCHIMEHRSIIEDFEILRHAQNVVLSVSTFSWVATWLSMVARNIYMPIYGLYNPHQRPDIDLLPVSDKRYHFYELPITKWNASQEQIDMTINGKNLAKKCEIPSLIENYISYKN